MCATVDRFAGMPTRSFLPAKRKTQRMVARVSAEDKAMIAQAAALAGQSVGSFMVAQARKAAAEALQARQRIQLNAQQSRRLVEVLLAPPVAATVRMKRARKLHRETVVSRTRAEFQTAGV